MATATVTLRKSILRQRIFLRPRKNVRKLSTTSRLGEDDQKATELTKSHQKLNYDFEFLDQLPREKLIHRILRLQRKLDSYVTMKGIENVDGRDKISITHPSIDSIIDHTKFNKRRVAFKVMYLGWDYCGYAWNPKTLAYSSYAGATNNVERVFSEALVRLQLIAKLQQKPVVKSAGRTDRDVSGMGQVITAVVRTNIEHGYGVLRLNKLDEADATEWRKWSLEDTSGEYDVTDTSTDCEEIDYVSELNRALPWDIRVIAWSPVAKDFDVRRDAVKKTYKYSFLRGDLDLGAMNAAAQKFVGFHNFRNFCKISSQNVNRTHKRRVNSVTVIGSDTNDPAGICYVYVTGMGFLHHQVRYMVSVLYSIGVGREQPEIIDKLLDVNETDRKPGYHISLPYPLTLCDVEYDESHVHWRYDDSALWGIIERWSENFAEHSIKSDVIKTGISTCMELLQNQDIKNELKATLGASIMGYHGAAPPTYISDAKSENNPIEISFENQKLREIRRLMTKGKYHLVSEVLERHEKRRVMSDEDFTNG